MCTFIDRMGLVVLTVIKRIEVVTTRSLWRGKKVESRSLYAVGLLTFTVDGGMARRGKERSVETVMKDRERRTTH